MMRAVWFCLVAVAAAEVEKQEEMKSAFADLKVLEKRNDASATLLVWNRAASEVRLANCEENHAIPAGGSVALTLSKISGFWVVPQELKNWDCQNGPFDLFYVGSDLKGPELAVGVAFGAGPEGTDQGTPQLAEAPATEGEAVISSVAGVEMMGVTPGEATSFIRCRDQFCEPSRELSVLPQSFILSVMPPQGGPLSFWGHHIVIHHYGGGGSGGGGGGGYGGGGGGGHHTTVIHHGGGGGYGGGGHTTIIHHGGGWHSRHQWGVR